MIKKIFLALALLCGSLQMSNAQEPLMCGFQTSILEAEVMGRGEDIKSAQLDAICQLYDKYATEVDSTSLLAHLQSLDSTFSLDRRTPWIEAMSANEILEIKDSLFQDSAYWVHVKVLPEAFTHFVDQIYRTKVMAASECLIRAHFGREQGNVFAAAGEYGKGLSLIVPLMHCSLVSDILEGKDLGFMLLEEYMTIFDGLTMEALDEELPVVSGEDIPLDARIMAVADVYDALTSKRCYKQAYSHEIAKEIMMSEKGTHFEGYLVDVFFENLNLEEEKTEGV